MSHPTNKSHPPVMAMNPYTEKLMNVEPLFKLFADFTSVEDCYSYTDDSIKFMALSPLPEWADMELKGEVVMFLYELREMFDRLQECEISVSKRKGGKL